MKYKKLLNKIKIKINKLIEEIYYYRIVNVYM